MRTNAPEFNLRALEVKGLSLRQQRDLQSMIKPLSSEGKMPARQDLAVFWMRASRAIRGLGGDIYAADLEEPHLDILAPLLLGDTAYELLKN